MQFRDYDKYEVYEDGRIFSYWTNKFLKPITIKNGYQRVYLYDNEGKRKIYLVHRIVYETFSGSQIPSNMQINHIDERKDNNSRSNLELVTPSENINYGTRNSRVAKSLSKAKKGIIPKANPPKQVGAFDKNGELVMTFQSTQEASRQGFNQGAVASCCRNCYLKEGNNVYKGYEWRYL